MKALLKKLLKFFIIIYLITQVLSCKLNYFGNNWEDDWRLLLIDNGRNQYELFRDQTVAAGENIVAVCNNKYEPITISCSAKHILNETLPFAKKCQNHESLQPLRVTEQASYCPYTLYKIGFKVDTEAGAQFLESYRVCFDMKHKRPLFTINKVYPVGGGRPGILKFNPDDIFKGREFSAFSRRASFERFKKLLGNDQRYMSDSNVDHIIDRGHLTPSADFTLTNFKHSTFNMINVIPQFKTIDNGNWRLIEEWTRHRSRTPGHVCTGVLNCDLDNKDTAKLNCVVQLKDGRGNFVPIFLADNRKIPIPLWSYKIVKKSRIVFLTLNNIYHRGDVPVPNHICKAIECPIKLSQNVKDGITFCCDYNDFINRNVPDLRQIC